MTTLHDIYDPPPAPLPLPPPPAEPLNFTSSDLGILGALVGAVVGLSAWAWSVEPMLSVLALIGGTVVIVESWSTALAFLHRRPVAGLSGRWKIFAAALLPWLLCLGLAAMLMLGLFRISDWIGRL